MRQDLNEIEKVFQKNKYNINNIICDIMKEFKFKTICCQLRVSKGSGYSITDVICLMILMPLMLLKSVHSLYKSQYEKTTVMKKDVIYRLKNSENMPWRTLLYSVAKRFKVLTSSGDVADNSCFIIDDTPDCRVGYKIENVSIIHDHANQKNTRQKGFKNLVLALFDGKSAIPLDYSIHTEKLFSLKQRKQQYKKECIRNSNGYKRRKECAIDKITNSLLMLKRAVKNGFMAKYVLADSWFTSKGFIQSVRGIKNGAMHVIGGVRNDKRNYTFEGKSQNAKQLISTLSAAKKQKRCRRWNTRYYEVIVNYEGIGDVKLYICRLPYQKKWRVFISTDTNLTFVVMMETYSIRWIIEVMFRELKQHLCLGKCQSRDFDAQIASIAISMILYIFLAYCRRKQSYETLGELFVYLNQDMTEKTLAQRLWELFDELLSTVIEIIKKTGSVDLSKFKDSREYQYIQELFTQSFLGNQLLSINKVQ